MKRDSCLRKTPANVHINVMSGCSAKKTQISPILGIWQELKNMARAAVIDVKVGDLVKVPGNTRVPFCAYQIYI